MPPTTYNYTISTDFPNQLVAPSTLEASIKQDPAITIALAYIDINITPDDCAITFVDALPVPDEAALDAIVATHSGYYSNALMQGTLPVANGAVTVTEDLNWQILEGVVTTPSFFSKDMNNLLGKVIGQYKCDGGELQIIEEVEGQADETKVVPPMVLPDSGGQWLRFTMDTNVPPRDGFQNVYRVEARRNGAASLEVRYSTFSMIYFEIKAGIGP